MGGKEDKMDSNFLAIAVAASIAFADMTPASAQPSEAWEDDDWAGCSLGDPVNGHIRGADVQ